MKRKTELQHAQDKPHSFQLLRVSSDSDLEDSQEESGQQLQADAWQRAADDQSHTRRGSCRKSLQAHRLSLSAQRYTSKVAARIRRSIDGFDYMQDASPDRHPCSYSIDEEEVQDCVAEDDVASFSEQAKIAELQTLWQHQVRQGALQRS